MGAKAPQHKIDRQNTNTLADQLRDALQKPGLTTLEQRLCLDAATAQSVDALLIVTHAIARKVPVDKTPAFAGSHYAPRVTPAPSLTPKQPKQFRVLKPSKPVKYGDPVTPEGPTIDTVTAASADLFIAREKLVKVGVETHIGPPVWGHETWRRGNLVLRLLRSGATGEVFDLKIEFEPALKLKVKDELSPALSVAVKKLESLKAKATKRAKEKHVPAKPPEMDLVVRARRKIELDDL